MVAGRQRVAVIGGGAIGSIVGGYVSSVADVVVADAWPDHVEAIERDGLLVHGVRGERRFRLRAVPLAALSAHAGHVDAAFVSVKSADTPATLPLLEHLSPDVIVSLQNGLNEELLVARFGTERVVGAVTEIGGALEAPGVVRETRRDGGFVVGGLDGAGARVEQVARLLDACAGTEITPNAWGVLWSKLTWNCMINPLSAITGLGQGRVVLDGDLRAVMLAIAAEVGALAQAEGVRLEPLTFLGIDPRAFLTTGEARRAAERQLVERYSSQLDKSTSMSQDVQKGRRTEVDHLNGAVVEKGDRLGIPTPVNRAIVDLVHRVEETRTPVARDDVVAAAASVPA